MYLFVYFRFALVRYVAVILGIVYDYILCTSSILASGCKTFDYALTVVLVQMTYCIVTSVHL